MKEVKDPVHRRSLLPWQRTNRSLMTEHPTIRNAMHQAVAAALGTLDAVFPAKTDAAIEPAAASFQPSPRLAEALAFAVEKHGTQEHHFTWAELATRYAASFGPLQTA